jgi:hypothetical protein
MIKLPLGCFVVLSVVAILGCDRASGGKDTGPTAKRSTRTTPVCATQDCATKKILDDGCAADGKCASCVNACPP